MLRTISRKYFIPVFFPDGRLSECKRTLVLSIQTRFYILFFAVSIVPMLLMLGVVRANGYGTNLSNITILTGIVLLLGAFLVYLVSRSYQVPLIEMADAAQEIQAGNYNIDISIVSNDEVGKLGEALNEMAMELKEKEFIKDTFGKVVDPKVRDHLLNGHIDLGGEIREATILFTDIRNFTPISAGMRPDQVVDWLNRFPLTTSETIDGDTPALIANFRCESPRCCNSLFSQSPNIFTSVIITLKVITMVIIFLLPY